MKIMAVVNHGDKEKNHNEAVQLAKLTEEEITKLANKLNLVIADINSALLSAKPLNYEKMIEFIRTIENGGEDGVFLRDTVGILFTTKLGNNDFSRVKDALLESKLFKKLPQRYNGAKIYLRLAEDIQNKIAQLSEEELNKAKWEKSSEQVKNKKRKFDDEELEEEESSDTEKEIEDKLSSSSESEDSDESEFEIKDVEDPTSKRRKLSESDRGSQSSISESNEYLETIVKVIREEIAWVTGEEKSDEKAEKEERKIKKFVISLAADDKGKLLSKSFNSLCGFNLNGKNAKTVSQHLEKTKCFYVTGGIGTGRGNGPRLFLTDHAKEALSKSQTQSHPEPEERTQKSPLSKSLEKLKSSAKKPSSQASKIKSKQKSDNPLELFEDNEKFLFNEETKHSHTSKDNKSEDKMPTQKTKMKLSKDNLTKEEKKDIKKQKLVERITKAVIAQLEDDNSDSLELPLKSKKKSASEDAKQIKSKVQEVKQKEEVPQKENLGSEQQYFPVNASMVVPPYPWPQFSPCFYPPSFGGMPFPQPYAYPGLPSSKMPSNSHSVPSWSPTIMMTSMGVPPGFGWQPYPQGQYPITPMMTPVMPGQPFLEGAGSQIPMLPAPAPQKLIESVPAKNAHLLKKFGAFKHQSIGSDSSDSETNGLTTTTRTSPPSPKGSNG